MNENRAPAQEAVLLCGRCYFRGIYPVRGGTYARETR